MNFIVPSFLWYLLLLFIPIIIHLISLRRYKIIYFSNNALLNEVVKQHKSKNILKNLLLLLVRLLIIFFLVLAFSQPYIPNTTFKKDKMKQFIAVYLDNSFSMSNVGEKTSLFDEAKAFLVSLIKALPSNFEYYFITNDKFYTFTKASTHLIEEIQKIKLSSNQKTLSEIINITKNIFKLNDLIIVTDCQKNFVDESFLKRDSLNIFLHVVNPQNFLNVSIDTVFFEVPTLILNSKSNLKIKLTNYGKKDIINLPLKIFINDTLRYTKAVTISGESSQTVLVDIFHNKPGFNKCEVVISDYPVIFDNTYYLTYFVAEKVNVAVVSLDYNKYLRAFFKTDTIYNVELINPKKFNSNYLKKFNVIIFYDKKGNYEFYQQIDKLLQENKTVILFLGNNENINQFAEIFKINLIQNDSSTLYLKIPDFKSDFFKNVFVKSEKNLKMPYARNCFSLVIPYQKYYFEPIIRYENNDIAVANIKFPKGNLLLFGLPLENEFTNLYEHPLFIPIIYKGIFSSTLVSQNFNFYTNEKKLKIDLPDTFKIPYLVKVRKIKDSAYFIPYSKQYLNKLELTIYSDKSESGFYSIDVGDNEEILFSLNYNRKESEMNYYDFQELEKKLKKLNYNCVSLNEYNKSIDNDEFAAFTDKYLWKYFILFTILFFIIEMLILSFWKRNNKLK